MQKISVIRKFTAYNKVLQGKKDFSEAGRGYTNRSLQQSGTFITG
jgi:hypothetical protein